MFDESRQNAVIKLPLVDLSSAVRTICILGGALNGKDDIWWLLGCVFKLLDVLGKENKIPVVELVC